MLKKILLLFIIIFTNSCGIPKSWDWGIKPRPFGMSGLPETDTEYGKGFREGCAAGLKAVSIGLMGDMKTKFDGQKMIEYQDYSTGWSDGYDYCIDFLDWGVP